MKKLFVFISCILLLNNSVLNAQAKNVVQTAPQASKKIVADDREEGDCFGWSSAIYGDRAVVGAMTKKKKLEQTLLTDAGAAYIFKKDAKGESQCNARNNHCPIGAEKIDIL